MIDQNKKFNKHSKANEKQQKEIQLLKEKME